MLSFRKGKTTDDDTENVPIFHKLTFEVAYLFSCQISEKFKEKKNRTMEAKDLKMNLLVIRVLREA